MAIIIDDVGYRQSDKELLSLPTAVTLSVIPESPLGALLARKAHTLGHEIMLHLPMESIRGNSLGDGGLTEDMTESQIKSSVTNAIAHIPFAKGANNHMGSLLTQLESPMSWVMASLKQHDMYFVDSLTTRNSKAGEQANRMGVPLLKRHLFLDNDTSQAALERQFKQMIAQTNRRGFLVAIAHPHPATIQFLEANLPRLALHDISLVPASQLLPYRLAKLHGTSPEVRLK